MTDDDSNAGARVIAFPRQLPENLEKNAPADVNLDDPRELLECVRTEAYKVHEWATAAGRLAEQVLKLEATGEVVRIENLDAMRTFVDLARVSAAQALNLRWRLAQYLTGRP